MRTTLRIPLSGLVGQLRSPAFKPSDDPLRTPANRRIEEGSAFTRADLVVVLGAIVLLVMLAIPVLANNRARSDRAVCQSNLRQIGRAFAMWAADHTGKFPYRTPGSEGGFSDHPLANNVWFQCYVLSNELVVPKVLVCPSDVERRPALDWSSSTNGGFNSVNGRNNSVSYVLSLGVMESPHGLLSVDRNIAPPGLAARCAAGIHYAGAATYDHRTVDWWRGLHEFSGNILMNDGSVVAGGREELRAAVRDAIGPSPIPGETLCALYPN